MGERIERCCECDQPTGKAGMGDGSLYLDGGQGPFCDSCYSFADWVRKSALREAIQRLKEPPYEATAKGMVMRLEQMAAEQEGGSDECE